MPLIEVDEISFGKMLINTRYIEYIYTGPVFVSHNKTDKTDIVKKTTTIRIKGNDGFIHVKDSYDEIKEKCLEEQIK